MSVIDITRKAQNTSFYLLGKSCCPQQVITRHEIYLEMVMDESFTLYALGGRKMFSPEQILEKLVTPGEGTSVAWENGTLLLKHTMAELKHTRQGIQLILQPATLILPQYVIASLSEYFRCDLRLFLEQVHSNLAQG